MENTSKDQIPQIEEVEEEKETPLTRYCKEHPDAPECIIYDV